MKKQLNWIFGGARRPPFIVLGRTLDAVVLNPCAWSFDAGEYRLKITAKTEAAAPLLPAAQTNRGECLTQHLQFLGGAISGFVKDFNRYMASSSAVEVLLTVNWGSVSSFIEFMDSNRGLRFSNKSLHPTRGRFAVICSSDDGYHRILPRRGRHWQTQKIEVDSGCF